MSVLEQARRAYARLKAQRNGHPDTSSPSCTSGGYDINDINDQSPQTPGKQGVSSALPSGGNYDKSPPDPRFWLVTDANMLQTAVWAVDESTHIGVDVETTGLNPRRDRVRLLSLATERGVYVVDVFQVHPRLLWDVLASRVLIGHNLAFDLAFLAGLEFEPGAVRDTLLLSQLLHAGTSERHRLQDCALRELGRHLDKDLQKSDWSAVLTQEQLAYAAADVDVLVPLYRALDAKVKAAGLADVAEIERRCLPAMVWLSRAGVAFDVEAWNTLAVEADAEAHRLAAQLDAVAPAAQQPGLFGSWSWDSPVQVKAALAAVGCVVESTDDDHLAAIDHPLAALLRNYRGARKRCTTYGKDWTKHVAADGQVYASWRQLGAAPGRMSCSAPNLQQLPRDAAYRRCFRAPPGRVLVKADYSQIELRIAAKVSGDKAMLAAYRAGEDLHTLTARLLLGREEVSKEDRQIAKSANFGLLYGMGPKGYRAYARSTYGVDMSQEQAQAYRAAFFKAYPGLQAWHRRIGRTRDTAIETRTLTGRRRLGVVRFTDKLNTPVQGTGADGFKLALALLWERRGDMPDAFPVLAVHDEIVVECDQDQAETAGRWLRQAMLDAMTPLLDPVPVEVELTTAPTWGG
jgi:DNA polymerase-1